MVRKGWLCMLSNLHILSPLSNWVYEPALITSGNAPLCGWWYLNNYNFWEWKTSAYALSNARVILMHAPLHCLKLLISSCYFDMEEVNLELLEKYVLKTMCSQAFSLRRSWVVSLSPSSLNIGLQLEPIYFSGVSKKYRLVYMFSGESWISNRLLCPPRLWCLNAMYVPLNLRHLVLTFQFPEEQNACFRTSVLRSRCKYLTDRCHMANNWAACKQRHDPASKRIQAAFTHTKWSTSNSL